MKNQLILSALLTVNSSKTIFCSGCVAPLVPLDILDTENVFEPVPVIEYSEILSSVGLASIAYSVLMH